MGLKREEIVKLSNEDLSREICAFNDEQMERIKKTSIFNVIHSLNNLENNLNEDKDFGENIQDEFDEIVKSSKELREIIIGGSKEDVLKIREDLYKKKTILDGYIIELSYVGELIDEYGIQKLAKENRSASNDINDLVAFIDKRLSENIGSYTNYVRIISEIIRILPMHMVRSNYFDVLEKTLNRNFKQFGKEHIDLQTENLKQQFDSTIRKGYGLEFDYYFMKIREYRDGISEDMSKEDSVALANKVKNTLEELIDIKEIVHMLGMVSNMIIVSYLAGETSEELIKEVEDGNKAMESEGKTLSKYNDGLYKKIKQMDYKIQERLNYYEMLTAEATERKDFDFEELDGKLDHTARVLSYFNDISFASIETVESYRPEAVDENYIKTNIESIKSYMNRAMQGMDNFERKIRMRKVLALLELPFMDMNEFKDYIRYALNDKLNHRDLISFKIQQIKYLLGEEGA